MKEINILKNYLLYILTFVLVCIVGISGVFADTYTVIGDKADITVVLVSTDYASSPFTVPKNSGYNFYEVLQIDYLVSNYNFEANKHYQLETHLSSQTLTNANYYTVTGLNGENCLISYENSIFTGDYPRWDFQCPHATNNITLSISNSSHAYLWSGSGIYNWQTALLSWSPTPIQGSGSDTDNIINNNNQNTQNIINNNNSNTQNIINNNNQNTQDIINNQNNIYYDDCPNLFDAQSWVNSGNNSSYYTYSNGVIITSLDTRGFNNFSSSEKIILPNGTYTFSNYGVAGLRIYNDGTDYPLVNQPTFQVTLGYIYVKFVSNTQLAIQPMLVKGSSSQPYCEYGSKFNKLDETKDAINDLNDSLNDDDSSGATSEASEFFSSFTTNTFGLTSIITAPLNLIQSLTSSTCSELHLPLPYLNNKYLDLPCMTSIYQTHFGSFFTMYQTITYGIIAYWVIVRIFNQVKDFKNPEHDEIEVVDL